MNPRERGAYIPRRDSAEFHKAKVKPEIVVTEDPISGDITGSEFMWYRGHDSGGATSRDIDRANQILRDAMGDNADTIIERISVENVGDYLRVSAWDVDTLRTYRSALTFKQLSPDDRWDESIIYVPAAAV